MRKAKVVLYAVLSIVVLFNLNFHVISRALVTTTHEIYPKGLITELGDYSKLSANDIDIYVYVQSDRIRKSDELNTDFQNSNPHYLSVDKTYSIEDLNTNVISVKMKESPENIELIAEYLGKDFDIYPVPLRYIMGMNFTWLSLLVILIIQIIAVILNIGINREAIYNAIHSKQKRLTVIRTITSSLKPLDYGILLVLITASAMFIQKPVSSLGLIIAGFTLFSVMFIELFLMVLVDIFYDWITGLVCNPPTMSKEPRFLIQALFLAFVFISSFLLLASISAAQYEDRGNPETLAVEAEYASKFGDKYYAQTTSKAISDGFDFKVTGDNPQIFMYEISERVLYTDKYYIDNYTSWNDVPDHSLLVVNGSKCDEQIDVYMSLHNLGSCQELDESHELYDFIINFGPLTTFSGGFIDAETDTEAREILTASGINPRYFIDFDKLTNVQAEKAALDKESMWYYIVIVILTIVAYIFTLAIYLSFCLITNKDKYKGGLDNRVVSKYKLIIVALLFVNILAYVMFTSIFGSSSLLIFAVIVELILALSAVVILNKKIIGV